MVFKRTSMKRKRKAGCSSPLLGDSPKRTKVHAQRKFAQGSNINSPVITPIKELENEMPKIDVLPEPVELLPIKRPNTEDFLTFLCFRGTPILPPSLNFFNTASIVDTNGQVHEIKSESPKNGPIDIAKCGTSSEKPFIAFGVRKRADPIVISRQMDRKRRHALALQALRRKYQEQKMAKIRALTISKLSEKVTNKTLVRTNTVSKTETVTKKTNTLQKTKVVATKHVKVTTQTLKTTLRPKVKPKMCLRSFRGRFVQKELPFRKQVVSEKKIIKKPLVKKVESKKRKDGERDNVSEDEPLFSIAVKEPQSKSSTTKVVKKSVIASTSEPSPRITRSGISNNKLNVRRQQIKKIMLLSTPNTIVKPRSLRSTTMKKTVLSQKKSKSLKAKQKLKAQQRQQNISAGKNEGSKGLETKKVVNAKKDFKSIDNKKDGIKTVDLKKEMNKSVDIKKCTDVKKESNRINERDIKQIRKTVDIKKEISRSTDIKKEINKTVDVKKINNKNTDRKEISSSKNVTKEITKSSEFKKDTKSIEIATDKTLDVKKDLSISLEKNKKETFKSTENIKKVSNILEENKNSNSICLVDQTDEKTNEDGGEVKDDKTKKLNKNEKSAQAITRKDSVSKKDTPETSSKKETNTKKEEENSGEVKDDKTKKLNKNEKSTQANTRKDSISKKDIPETSSKKDANTKKSEEDSGEVEDDKTKTLHKNEKSTEANTRKDSVSKKDVPETSSKKDAVTKKEVPIPTDNTTKKELFHKKDVSDTTVKKDANKNSTNKCKKESHKKEDTIKKEDAIKKKNTEKFEEDQPPPKMTQRPSRKTKEAAAIYMEILSHKLVNDSKIDDDNISIDSFPELPNVKKTEQRENELKAQAKSTKDDTKDKSKSTDYETETENKNLSTLEDTSDTTSKHVKTKPIGIGLHTKRSIEEKKAVDKQKIQKTNNETRITDNTKSESIVKVIPRKLDEKKVIDKQKIKKTNTETSITDNTKSESIVKVMPSYKEKSSNDVNLDKPVQNKTEREGERPVSKTEGKLVSKKQSAISPDVKKPSLGKKKSISEERVVINTESEAIKKPKLKIPDNIKSLSNSSDSIIIKKDSKENISDKNISKRQTRNASQTNKKGDSDDSDESFHIDIKVPRKKKLTRSKISKPIKNERATEKQETPAKLITENTKSDAKPKQCVSSSDSDHSTTSDINLETLRKKTKNKKFSKTKSMKKPDTAFSDSDEEPLSKLTNRSVDGSQKSAIPGDKTKEKPIQELKGKDVTKSVTKYKSSSKTTSKPEEVNLEAETVKPKRECAKRPQNYLPMLSSSDEDDIFHGFDEKIEKKINNPIPSVEPSCSHAPPLLDLLSKDIGRRFGKGKVNMSNEQIEKWLKDSALAGSSIKKENDEMLKFGERIPTETTLEGAEHIDTQKLKCSLLEARDSKKETNKDSSAIEDSNSAPLKSEKTEPTLSSQAKPQTGDRKLIFRKSRKDSTPNVNAFSPENECSVYAFGEENEDVISTPFRRPSRRPSSTATSRSEDESSKHDDSLKAGHFRKPSVKQDMSKTNKEESDVNADTDESSHHFYIPQKPTKHNFSKVQPGNSLHKPKIENRTILKPGKSSDRISDLDDFKYKIPSSPSASSSSSAKLYKRQTQKQKIRPPELISPVYLSDFPKRTDPAKLVEAPVFHPTDQEFQDPLEYIERIRHKAEQFGICRIVPPSHFKPECKVTDDMRFTAYNQYVNKMLHRWGPNFKELMAIKKYLETQNISLTHPPWIGGMEIDLPRLYQTVQTLGGLKEVIEKKKWPRVSELMKIPKSAQDRVTKLDDIYCKYLLPYDTLSPAEREKLFDEVETEWAKRESKSLMKAQQKLVNQDTGVEGDSEPDDNDVEECITKGRNVALNAFYRIARNTMSMHFKTADPTAQEVEQEYWKHVTLRQNHICVHSGSIDSGSWGYGFAVSKNSPFARHAWNLKVLTNNSGSVLRSLGPIMGVTVPTLHVGMVFSACCWYRDPHGLPWIEYLHTGGSKIWYGIPNSTSDLFHASLKKLVPNYCKNKELWLTSDTAMVPPSLLIENNVSLCRTVQDPGQFVVVFPKVFTSSISTGYVVSESVYFAPPYWLKTARGLFDELKNSREPSMFSLDRLLLSIASDARCSPEILRQVVPHIQELCDKEKERRLKLITFGTMEREKMPLPEANNRKRKKLQGEEGDYECEICRMNLFVSMVFDTQEAVTYCLDHAIDMIENKKLEPIICKFMFTYDDEELEDLPNKAKMAVENKLLKRIPNKYAGMPTLLTK